MDERDDQDFTEPTVEVRRPLTVEEYAFERDRDEREGDRALRSQELREATSRRLAAVWAPVVAAIVLGFLAWLGFTVHAVTTEHEHEHARQVTVWCYADPNSDRGTSTLTGTLDQVRSFCPDQRQPTYDPLQNGG